MAMIEIERNGPVAIVRFDRGGKANALSLAAIDELTEAARSFERDADTHVIILTGTERIFCAGIDINDQALWKDYDNPVARHIVMERGGAMCDAWTRLSQLTIAAVEGPAIGGGAVLAMALDWRVMAHGAHLRLPEARLGLYLSWGAVPRLTSFVGPARAKRMILCDLRVDAELALDWGLAEARAADGQTVQEALRLAEEVNICPPHLVRMSKRAVEAQVDTTRYAHADVDQFYLTRELAGPDDQMGKGKKKPT